MRSAKLLAAALALFALTGCVSEGFKTTGSFATVVPRVTPIAVGTYIPSEKGVADQGFVFALRDNGEYWLSNDGKPEDNGAAEGMSIFGPVNGFYVAQAHNNPDDKPGSPYGNLVFKIGAGNVISIVDDEAIQAALGNVLFGDLGVPSGEAPRVIQLTDNAALNWVIVQRAIVRHAADFTFGLDLAPAPPD